MVDFSFLKASVQSALAQGPASGQHAGPRHPVRETQGIVRMTSAKTLGRGCCSDDAHM